MSDPNFLLESLSIQRILVRHEVSSRKKLLEEVARLLCSGFKEQGHEKDVYRLLWEREKLGNTGIGNGIALPHARCPYSDKALVAIISLSKGVDYDATDRQDVDLVFGLLVPEDASQDHLNLLATIARLMSDPSKKDQLHKALSPKAAINLIEEWTQESE